MAEVLITLGIIGIVAAMTLPALLNKADEYVRLQQFKKVYNTLNNALARSFADNGGYYYVCYYGQNKNFTECENLLNDLKKILNIIKVCEDNALRNGCVSPEMKGFDTVRDREPDLSDEEWEDYSKRNCGGFMEANIKTRNPAWVLPDGSIIGFYGPEFSQLFWVDINGLKGPNKWGYDIFGFLFYNEGNSLVKVVPMGKGSCACVEKGGRSGEGILKMMY